ncbi:MAG: hypothetical protein R3C61_22215 [Bacteroidia bacterium]
MSLKLGIYDFFAYTIPGGLVLIILFGTLELSNVSELISFVGELSFTKLFIFAICAYLNGFIFDSIISKWAKIYQKKDFVGYAFAEFKDKYPKRELRFDPYEYPIWIAGMRRENLDLAIEIDRFMALSKMVRGVAFALQFGGLVIIILSIFTSISLWFILLGIILVFLSIITVNQSKKFHKWYYWVIFETILSLNGEFQIMNQITE